MTYTDLVQLCLTTPRTPKPIRDAAEHLQRGTRPGPAASYTNRQAETVRLWRAKNYSIRSIAGMMGLSPSIVARICKTSPKETDR